ncbi:MAG TPA: ABC transporter permease subunit [Terriglobales bacterium]|nr:ABC transporter permease subunit [Terriglobales bacterium]
MSERADPVRWEWSGLRRLVFNPLIVKDGLARVRSWRAPAVIALYLGLLGLFAWLAFSIQLTGFPQPTGFARVASNVFTALALVQLALVCLVTPALAAGAVSGERERQTLDVLLVSCVPSFGIVWGKLVASVAFVLLLILAALPLFATVFLFGGIDGQQFLVAQLLTATTALAVAAVSLFLSTMFRRTLGATVVAYGLTFAATAASWYTGTILLASGHIRVGQALLFANPIQAMLAALQGASSVVGRAGGPPAYAVTGGGLVPLGPRPSAPAVQPWEVTVAIELAIVAVAAVGTMFLLRERRGGGSGSG